MRLTLLRAPRFPDPTTDQGRHQLSFGLVVGATVEDAVAHGYAVNLPLRVVDSSDNAGPLVSVDNPSVVVEAVKLAEDRSGDLVVRLYEASGGRAVAHVRTSFESGAPVVVDLLEQPLTDPALAPVVTEGVGATRLQLRPFQVATLRFPRG